MTRGRRPNLDLPVTPSLNAQRAFRERKRKHLQDLETSVQRLGTENEHLKRQLAAVIGEPAAEAAAQAAAQAAVVAAKVAASSSMPASSSTGPTWTEARVDVGVQTVNKDGSLSRPACMCDQWAAAYSTVAAELDRLRSQLSGLLHGQQDAVPSPNFGSRGQTADSTTSPSWTPVQQPSSTGTTPYMPPLPPSYALSPKHATGLPHLSMAGIPPKRRRTTASSSTSTSPIAGPSPRISTPNAGMLAPPSQTQPQSSNASWTLPATLGSAFPFSTMRGSVSSSQSSVTIDDSRGASPSFTSTGAEDAPTASSSSFMCCVEEAALAKGASPTTAARQGCGGSLRHMCDLVADGAAERRAQQSLAQVQVQQHHRSASFTTVSGQHQLAGGAPTAAVSSTDMSTQHGPRHFSLPSLPSSSSSLALPTSMPIGRGLTLAEYGLMTLKPKQAGSASNAMANFDVDPQRPGGLAGIFAATAAVAAATGASASPAAAAGGAAGGATGAFSYAGSSSSSISPSVKAASRSGMIGGAAGSGSAGGGGGGGSGVGGTSSMGNLSLPSSSASSLLTGSSRGGAMNGRQSFQAVVGAASTESGPSRCDGELDGGQGSAAGMSEVSSRSEAAPTMPTSNEASSRCCKPSSSSTSTAAPAPTTSSSSACAPLTSTSNESAPSAPKTVPAQPMDVDGQTQGVSDASLTELPPLKDECCFGLMRCDEQGNVIF